MAGAYRRDIEAAAASPAPRVELPTHLRPDPMHLATSLAGMGIDLRLE